MTEAPRVKRLTRRGFIRATAVGIGVAAAVPVKVTAGPATASTAAPTAAQATPAPTTGGELILGLYRTLDSLDPLTAGHEPEATVMTQIFDPLVWLSPDLKFAPGLATSWDISPDGTAYTFKLRQGVKFHDGTPLTADAVQFTFDRVAGPTTKPTVAKGLIGPVYDTTEVVDPATVRIKLKSPYAPFLDAVSQSWLGIVSPSAVQELGDKFASTPVGTGPFRAVEFDPQTHVTIERNPDYTWGPEFWNNKGAPYIDRFTVKFIREDATRMATLDTGETNWVWGPRAEDVERWKADPSTYKLLQPEDIGFPISLIINTQKAPTDDLAVRQALLYAVSQEEIVSKLFDGVGRPAHGPLAPSTWGYDPAVEQLYPFNPDKAKQILDDAGWTVGSSGVREKNGQPLKLVYFIHQNLPSVAFYDLVQARLKAIGFDFENTQGDESTRDQLGQQGAVNLVNRQVIWSDPVSLNDLFHSKNIGGFNWGRVNDSELDKLLEQGPTVIDQDQRKAVYSQIQKRIMQQAYVLPIYTDFWTYGMRSEVNGMRPDPRAWYPWLTEVWLQT